MAERLDLVHASAGLLIGIVPRADGTHGSGFISSVGLSGVLEVGVRATGAVHANVTCVGDMRATVRLAHDGHDGDTRGRADGLCNQFGEDIFLIVLWDSGDDGRQRGLVLQIVFL